METISIKQIKEAWDRQAALDAGLMRQFLEEQPILIDWFLAFCEKYPARTEKETLLPLALLVWDVMTRTKGERLETVTPKQLKQSVEAHRKISEELASLPKSQAKLRARQFEFTFPRPTLVMGIVNVTPDSFSDGGQFLDAKAAVAHALHLVALRLEEHDLVSYYGEAYTTYQRQVRMLLPVPKGSRRARVRQ